MESPSGSPESAVGAARLLIDNLKPEEREVVHELIQSLVQNNNDYEHSGLSELARDLGLTESSTESENSTGTSPHAFTGDWCNNEDQMTNGTKPSGRIWNDDDQLP